MRLRVQINIFPRSFVFYLKYKNFYEVDITLKIWKFNPNMHLCLNTNFLPIPAKKLLKTQPPKLYMRKISIHSIIVFFFKTTHFKFCKLYRSRQKPWVFDKLQMETQLKLNMLFFYLLIYSQILRFVVINGL